MDRKENKGGFITNEELEKDLEVKSKTSVNPGHQQGNTTPSDRAKVKEDKDQEQDKEGRK